MNKKNAKWFLVLAGMLFLLTPILAVHEGQIITREQFKNLDLNLTNNELVNLYEPTHESTTISFQNDNISFQVSFFTIAELPNGDFVVERNEPTHYSTPMIENGRGWISWWNCTEGNPINIATCWSNYFLPKLKIAVKKDIRNYHNGLVELQQKIIVEDFFSEFNTENYNIVFE